MTQELIEDEAPTIQDAECEVATTNTTLFQVTRLSCASEQITKRPDYFKPGFLICAAIVTLYFLVGYLVARLPMIG